MEDLKRKLSSRKFWGMAAALAVCICAMFNMPESEVGQIVALIGAFGDIAVYMYSEAKVDAANSTSQTFAAQQTTVTSIKKTEDIEKQESTAEN